MKFASITRDDKGAALTEFAIVILVVLLFFLSMLQSFFIHQASQLGNYAAYSAARVYAVRASVDGEEIAHEKARTAAVMVLAPIARLMPGELVFLGQDVSQIQYAISSSGSSLVKNVLGSSGFAEPLESGFNMGINYAMGLVVADQRLNPDRLGGSIEITTSGDPKQVHVAINYPQPIFIPGFAPLWNAITGEKVFTSMKPLAEGLEGFPQAYASAQIERERLQRFFDRLGLDITVPDPTDSFISSVPYVNVRSKCSMGYEEWGHKPSYRPRQRMEAGRDGESTDPDLEKNAKDQKEKAEELKGLQEQAKEICDRVPPAEMKWKEAEAKLSQTEPNTSEWTSVKQTRDSAKADYDSKKADCERVGGMLEEKAKALKL